MQEVQEVTIKYKDLARSASNIFFCLLSLSKIHYLYHFSLQFFMDIIHFLLNENEGLKGIAFKKKDVRLKFLKDELFKMIYERVGNSLLNKDTFLFVMRLAQIKLGSICQKEFNNLIKESNIVESKLSKSLLDGKLSDYQRKLIEEISAQDRYNNLIHDLEENSSSWYNLIQNPFEEQNIPASWLNENYEQNLVERVSDFEFTISTYLRDMTILRIFRPDVLNFFSRKFINSVLGENFMDINLLEME